MIFGIWDCPAQLHEIAIPLGADVAMCLAGRPTIARGIGEQLLPLLHPLPPLYAVLAHPRVPLLTKDVYAAFAFEAGIPSWRHTIHEDSASFIASLAPTRNHLQPAAIAVDARVMEVLLALETLDPQPSLVRMSGSGACCFALYTAEAQAARAATELARQHPQWWVKYVVIET